MIANRFSPEFKRFLRFSPVYSCQMRLFLGLGLLIILVSLSASGREIAGFNLPESVQVDDTHAPLVLNGAGIRRKFFFPVYVGALYLPNKTTDAKEAIAMMGDKRVTMRFIHSEIPARKLATAWREGFADNLSTDEMRRFNASIVKFWSMFPGVRKGDEIDIDQLADKGVGVTLNGKPLGRIDDPAFMSVLLRIWLGKEPASNRLKRDMLGG